MEHKYSLILASTSPRRKELLGHMNVSFTIQSMNLPEVTHHRIPSHVVVDLARQKGEAVYSSLEKENQFGENFFPFIIAADTIVALENEILGKPHKSETAREMLKKLSGVPHDVYTGVYMGLLDTKTKEYREKTFFVKTKVHFSNITEDLLDNYIQTKDPLDKAGAYGIQGQALTFIEKIEGCYSNVVGLPIQNVISELKEILDHKFDQKGQWRSMFH